METPADPVICVGDSYLGLFDWRISDQFVLVESRRGAGKTRAILTLFMCRALAHPGSAWLVVRSTRVRLSDSAIKTFVEQVLPLFGLPIPTCQRSQIHNYRLPNGSEFIFQGLDDPGRQQSVECAGVYVVEGVEIEEIETITALAGAMRQVCTPPIPVHQCIVDCNPGHPSHPLNTISEQVDDSLRLVETKEQYLALVEHNQKPCTEPRRWKRIIAQHYDNPGYFDAERWEWLAAGLSYLKTLSWLTGYLVKQWLHGLWVAKEGSVFAGYFTRTRNVCPRFPIPKSWPIYFFLDPGRDHPCGASWVAISPTRKRFIIAEIHESGLDYDSTAEKIKNIERGMGMTVTKRFLDPNAGFHHTYFAKHGASIAEEFVKLGLVFEAWARLAGPSKEAAVNVLCRSFKAGEVVVFEDCPGVISECETWAFKRNRAGERLTGDDQYVDANNHCFSGSTQVWTTQGLRSIESLVGTVGELVTPYGVRRFYNVHRKRLPQMVYRWVFSDGSQVMATIDHKIQMADGSWRPLDCINQSDKITCINGYDHHFGHDSGIQRPSILEGKRVLFASSGKEQEVYLASDSVGIPSWQDPYENGRPPQGWKPKQQPNREPAGTLSVCAQDGAPSAMVARASRGGKTPHDREDGACGESLALFTRGLGVASGERKKDGGGESVEEICTGVRGGQGDSSGEAACLLQDGCGDGVVGEDGQGLKISGRTATLVKSDPVGFAHVYDLSVEGLHCFIVNDGLVVSNCLDGLIAEEVMDLPYQQGHVPTEQERERQVMEQALSINQAGPGRE